MEVQPQTRPRRACARDVTPDFLAPCGRPILELRHGISFAYYVEATTECAANAALSGRLHRSPTEGKV